MTFFRREVWSYAVLLIILLCIASLATRATISYIESGGETDVITTLIWALTLGFMLIAGAFGLWAIRFAAAAESRRQIGRLVDAMDDLSDALVVVDRKGRITGSNPAAEKLLGSSLSSHSSIRDLLPTLSTDDLSLLLDSRGTNEVEREFEADNRSRILRFRSQPTDDWITIVISDITRMNAQRLHSRQMAMLQLVGQLARGAARDLNDLFSQISSNASLLPRLRPGSAEVTASTGAILKASERGVTLAGHLLELAQPGGGSFTDTVGKHVATAVSMLRDSLPTGWKVEDAIEDALSPVSLSGTQVEQMALHLGLLAADTLRAPGEITISVGPPSSKPLFDVGARFAAVILITARIADARATPGQSDRSLSGTSEDSGIIQSVIRSMIEEAGGTLYNAIDQDQNVVFRLTLPRGVSTGKEEVTGLSESTQAYLPHWTVLFARPPREYKDLDQRLTELGARATRVDTVTAALARIEESRPIDAMILDKYLLGHEANALLKAILKLQPLAGIVVLCDDPTAEPAELASDIVFVQNHADPNQILGSLATARTIALRRKSSRRTGA